MTTSHRTDWKQTRKPMDTRYRTTESAADFIRRKQAEERGERQAARRVMYGVLALVALIAAVTGWRAL
jgi:hypothetical protein